MQENFVAIFIYSWIAKVYFHTSIKYRKSSLWKPQLSFIPKVYKNVMTLYWKVFNIFQFIIKHFS